MERPRINNKIVFSGNKALAVTYKKLAVRLLESCRLHASYNKLGVYAMERKLSDGTVIKAQIVGNVPTATVTSPWAKKEPIDKDYNAPMFVVIVGNEQIGYKVAIVPVAKDATPKLKKFPSMREIFRFLPPVRQRELYTKRYSIKTDLGAYDISEPLHELYVSPSDGNLHLSEDDEEVLGPRCSPVPDGGLYCPIEPMPVQIFLCQDSVTGETEVMDAIVPNEIIHKVEVEYTSRKWCYERLGFLSNWARKSEAVVSIASSPNRLSFGTDIVKRRGHEDVELYYGNRIENVYELAVENWACDASWEHTNTVPFSGPTNIALGNVIIELIETPVGRAVLLGDTGSTFSVIRGFYNSDEGSLTNGASEPFTYPVQSELHANFMKEIAAFEAGETNLIGAYAYTDSSFFVGNMGTWLYRGQSLGPNTKYVSAVGLPAYTKIYGGADPGPGPTYNNMCLKNVSFAVEHDYGVTHVYFKNFLEVLHEYNSETGMWDKTLTRQVALGASNHKNLNFLENLRRIFEFFRADDLAEGLLTPDDPEPVKGTVMAYLFNWNANGPQALSEDLEIFDRINALRASLGKPPYAWSHDLSVAARIQAEDMAANHYLGHIGSDGSTPGQRLDGTGLAGLAVEALIIGENCAMGQETPEDAIQGWINSPPHYAAMIHDKFTEIGIGVSTDETGKKYWCTTFAGDPA